MSLSCEGGLTLTIILVENGIGNPSVQILNEAVYIFSFSNS